MKKIFWLLMLVPFLVKGQSQPNSSQIRLKLKKLDFLGSVLYMAAHPDDENTRVITSLANQYLAETAYLSLTRGDGGQNLIGPELRDHLGVIRTQELLAARRIDGGKQFFTRAVDFGFSKSATETFEIWGKDEIMHDVVKVFRQYQPDVIITRFPPDARAGHGHHTASAIFAQEAFDIAAQADKYPELTSQFGVWSPKRLYTNTGRWWNKDINENTPGVITLDVGGYSSLLGKSFNEIAALSSSQHKSQGWGRAGERGYSPEFLEFIKGEKAVNDIFEGVNTSWSRVKGGEKVQPLVRKALHTFNDENPSATVPYLIEIRKAIQALENSVWKQRKLEEVDRLISDCLGLFTQATASYFHAVPGYGMNVSLEIVNRSGAGLRILNISSEACNFDSVLNKPLNPNEKLLVKGHRKIKEGVEYSSPYWLNGEHEPGIFHVKKPDLIGLPENNPAVDFKLTFAFASETFTVSIPLIYKWVDPVKGELVRPLEIVPPVFINIQNRVLVFTDDQPKSIPVQLISTVDSAFAGILRVQLPDGWKAEPETLDFSFEQRGVELNRVIKIIPSKIESKGKVGFVAHVGSKKYDRSLQLIQYDHIPTQTLQPFAQASLVRLDLNKEGKLVGYIKGAGDDIPTALRNIGYEVWEMSNEEVTADNLKKLDAVVLGIRALNTNNRIRYFMSDLLEYAENGGTLIIQYNTNQGLGVDMFSPFPMKISRDRVTQEDSEVTLLKPQHPVLNTPNKITLKDFEGWVQERGLYFPNEWDNRYEAVLSMNDKGESAKTGSLLVSQVGKGYFVYTGLSFFRELPEGVAGAYRLFANIVSLKQKSPSASKETGKSKK